MKEGKKRALCLILSDVLCVMMVLTLLPVTVLAANVTPTYLNATGWTEDQQPEPTGLAFGVFDSENTIAVFINGGSGDTYTTTATSNGKKLFINNVDVTVDESGMPSDFRISGSGSLNMGTFTVGAGNCTTAFTGNATAVNDVFAFYQSNTYSGETPTAVYDYTVTGDTTIQDFLTAYDLTIEAGKTLTIIAPPTPVKESDPEHYRLTVLHSLTADGTLTAAEGQELEIRENATVSSIDLFDTNGTSTYTLDDTHATEFFTFTDSKWVRQGGEGGDNPPLTAPTVSFCVQNTDTATGTVQYKINDGAWTSLALSLEGESLNQHLAGTVSDSLAKNDVIHIKATPGTNYEMDTTRGVKVWIDGADSPVAVGTTNINSEEGQSYTLSENKNYEFEFGFSESNGGGGEGGATHTITPSVVGGNGSIVPGDVQTVDEGQGRQFTFQPDNGYEVDKVLVDGNPVSITAPEYEFQNVTANHTISVSFKQITGAAGDAATAKERIEVRRWAYGGADATAIKNAFVAELWDMAVHEFSGVFADSAAVTAAVTLSNETYTVSSEFYRAAETLCPYYTFTVELGENDASGKVYVLDNTADYVVMTTTKTTNVFHVVSGEQCTVTADYDKGGITVFGNGAAIEGQLGSGENFAAFHVTTRAGLGASTFRLTVYKTSFVGSTVALSDSYKAAAWGFAQAKIAEFGSSAAPTEFEVYFGNSSVTLSAENLSDIGIRALVKVTSALPDGAVTITDNGGDGNAKTFTIAFNSNFYDEVPLTITYTDKTGGNSTAYLTLKRVGIDIQAYQKTGDSNGNFNTNHGTDPGLQNQSWGGDDYAVYASYYYPTEYDNEQNKYVAPTTAVQFYATYTWKNGTVTREMKTAAMRTDGGLNSVPIDDFLLYKGAESGAPAKIEVTAVKTGGPAGVFAGATLGSGAGVEWAYVARVS